MNKDEQGKLQQEVSQSNKARQLLDNPLFKEALNELKKLYAESLFNTGAKETETREKIGRSGNLSTGTGREYEPERVFTKVKLLELSANTLETRLTMKKAITRALKNVLGFI